MDLLAQNNDPARRPDQTGEPAEIRAAPQTSVPMQRGVLVVDSTRTILFLDEAAAAILGGPPQSFLGKACGSITELLPCATASCRLPLPCPLLVAGETSERARRGEASVRSNDLCSFESQVIVNQAGRPNGVIHIVTLPEPTSPQPVETVAFCGIIGAHPSMKKLFELISLVATTDVTVHISGPTGVGKELVADAIHALSSRSPKQLVKLNCSTIPATLLESTLFGHAKGSFTGAVKDAEGFVERAHGGTLFLDEIGDVSLEIQVKLLRLLESRSFSRVGETRSRTADIRIITATNQELRKLVTSGKMREDFFYRINVFPLTVPPLRERGTDLLLLANHFIELFNSQFNRRITGLSPAATAALRQHPWPGNVRELRHAIEHAFVHAINGELLLEHLPHLSAFSSAKTISNHDLIESARLTFSEGGITKEPADDRRHEQDDDQCASRAAHNRPLLTPELLEKALRDAGGNASEAARRCGVSRVTLWKYMKRYGISRTA